ncbi:MAG: hypothetical protein AAGA85_19245 [Bacteroidota bacterium]
MLARSPKKIMAVLVIGFVGHFASAQQVEKVLFSFNGYYESVMGTVSYVESVVHWSYLYEEGTDRVRGLRQTVPQEGYSTDFLISELWGNGEAVMFIADETAILMLKKFAADEVGPIVSISKVSELEMPRHQRSFCRYFAQEDFQDLPKPEPTN